MQTAGSAARRAHARSRLGHPAIKVAVVAPGYGLASQAIKETERDITIEMPKEGTIRGRLLTANGTPAAGAVVKITSVGSYGEHALYVDSETRESDLPRYWPRPVTTDNDGRFSLSGIPAGSHVGLDVRHPACAREDMTVDTGQGETDHTRDWDVRLLPASFRHSLGPARPVEGVVTAADTGKPLANVLVEVIPMGRHGGMQVYTHTDARGHYRVSDRAGFDWWIAAYPPPDSGYLATTKNFERWPAGAAALVHDIALPRGKLVHGRVLDDQTGKPIAGASVQYHAARKNAFNKSFSGGSEYEFRSPVLSEGEGRFQLTGLAGQGFLTVETADRAYVRKPLTDTNYFHAPMPMGYTPLDVPIEGEKKDDVVIRLQRGRSLTLRAVGPRGEKLPWVRAAWQGIDACHEEVWNGGKQFADGQIPVRGLDPAKTTRFFMIHNDL